MTTAEKPLPQPAQLADDLAESMHLFWETLAQLEPHEVESAAVMEGWSPKAVVAHIAFWDDFQMRRMAAALAGASARDGFARPTEDNDSRARADAERTWEEVAAAAQSARDRLIDFTRRLPPEALARDFSEGERTLSILGLVKHMARHVQEHRREVDRYCGSMARWSRADLRALLETQTINLLDSAAGLSEAKMLSTAVCGVWSIRDVLAHVLSWNELCVHLLTQWPEPNPALIEEWAWRPGDTMDTINARLMAARAQRNIIEIADGLATCHRKIMTAFDRFSDADLEGEGQTWGGPGVLSSFFYAIALHEAEHAAQVWAYRAGEKVASSR